MPTVLREISRKSQRAMHLIWDFDGTLAHREGGWAGACVSALDDHDPDHGVRIEDVRPHLQTGFPWHEPEKHHEWSSAAEWWNNLFPVFTGAFESNGLSPDRARLLARRVRSTYVNEGWHVFADTRETLSRLADDGWTHVVLSNHVPELESIVGSLGLDAYVDTLYVSADIGYEKPHPKAFEPVCAAIEPDTTAWMIGDSYSADVRGAETVDIPAILVRRHHEDATHCVEDLSAVASVVDR